NRLTLYGGILFLFCDTDIIFVNPWTGNTVSFRALCFSVNTVPFHENLHIIRNIKINYSDLHIIAYVDKEDVHLYNDLLAAGVSGVFVKSADPQQIRRLLYSILDGDTVIPLWLVDAYRSRKSEDPVIGMEHLSDRDKQILQCVSNGYTNSEIAAELHLSVRSIETNLSKIYRKLNVKSRLEAVKQGYAIGFIK
ncbi:response regulator transcription factor, partial [Paenibacillus sp. MSJ-34]|uniref:response regulator transcription factor n=1 Tax=Paenibacillus sp. MSJ-34 TaxID=2841529 RepID=UPI001C0F6F07